ncbi:NUDIX domain-containing protein [Gracilibacillus sp. D59]|uniref:NUDIX domain-containing protein n=1 Tax=Gracilibacillus sp. D59 TaxID=3457434 RepID=UPI003FCCFBE2
MKLRQMSVAFLFNDSNQILFLQKNSNSKFLPGLMVPIGGHLNGDEIDSLFRACVREIEEETGLRTNNIKNITLQYIILRMKNNNEIRIQYVYFGKVLHLSEIKESDEGSLSWIDYEEIINQNVSATTKEIIKHYRQKKSASDEVYVGSMKSLKGEPGITWSVLEDWELCNLIIE